MANHTTAGTKLATTSWRVPPVAWVPISLAILAETASNALRAYGLGTHLERFTVSAYGYPVSTAGAVLVVAAFAVTMAQARAAWVALTPGPTRQRIIGGVAALLLLAVSATAMVSHLLEANRSKTGDEGNSRERYDRPAAAHKKASAELDALSKVRTVAEVEAALRVQKVDLVVWRRSNGCQDISLEISRQACDPYLALLPELASAKRKAELETRVESLRGELEKKWRPEEASASEVLATSIWAWIMGMAVVFIATFGTVIFARVEVIPSASEEVEMVVQEAISQPVPPTNGGHRHDIPVNHPVIVALRPGKVGSNDELADRLSESKGEASKKRREVSDYLVERRVGGGRVEIDLKPEVRQALG